MKNSRTLKSIFAIVMLVVTLFTFGGCDIIMDYLGIKNELTITATYVGDPIEVGGTLDKNDIVVEATFVEGIAGTENVYLVTNFTVSSLDTSTEGDKTVQVTYTEMGIAASCQLTISVVKKAVPVSIYATYNGGDVAVGGAVNQSDFSVLVVYDDNTTKVADSFTISKIDTTTAGDKIVTVTYTYLDGADTKTLQTTVKVTVVATFVRISASFVGEPLQVGDTLTKDNLLVQELYDDGTKITVDNFTFGQVDTSTAGTKQVTISYDKNGTTYNATINVTVVEVPVTLTSISATFTNSNFYVGQTLSLADFVVVASFSDQHDTIVTDFTITGSTTFATSGSHTVQLSYTHEGVTKTCNVTVSVLALPLTLDSITATASKSEFYVGDTLQLTDFVVTAHFIDGNSLAVSDFAIVSPTGALESTGDVEVELSYTFNSQTRYATLYITVLAVEEEVANYGKYGILSEDGKSVKVVDTAKVVDTTDLQIHFLELGNQYTGDCIYIKAGDTDILIDAGSRKSSAQTIGDYIDQFVTDGTLEYVIATHADQDHIAGFVGTTTAKGIFSRYVCENIIDFPLSNKTTQVSKDYKSNRDAEVASGANHYTALECWNADNSATRFTQSVDATGARRYFKLSANVEMEILYNYYYEHTTSDENDYSVCIMFNQYGENYDFNNLSNPENEKNVNHFLFTGDLEESGEGYLVQYNDLPEVVLYKAGHHGSKTSSTAALLAAIKPKVVCVCCCTGSDEYTDANENQFPTQLMINRVAPYTDLVFATTVVSTNSSGYTSLNGNITLTCNNLGVNITASNNVTLLKDTEWFKANRTCPTEWQ